jgi:hypothetical protein
MQVDELAQERGGARRENDFEQFMRELEEVRLP